MSKRESFSILVFLAGNINKENGQQAIDFVQLISLNLYSGIRTIGLLDELKL